MKLEKMLTPETLIALADGIEWRRLHGPIAVFEPTKHETALRKHADAWRLQYEEWRSLGRRLEEAQARIRELETRTYCAWCGFRVDLTDADEASRLVAEHVAVCEKHPMAALRKRVEEAIAHIRPIVAMVDRVMDEWAHELPANLETSTVGQHAEAALRELEAALGPGGTGGGDPGRAQETEE